MSSTRDRLLALRSRIWSLRIMIISSLWDEGIFLPSARRIVFDDLAVINVSTTDSISGGSPLCLPPLIIISQTILLWCFSLQYLIYISTPISHNLLLLYHSRCTLSHYNINVIMIFYQGFFVVGLLWSLGFWDLVLLLCIILLELLGGRGRTEMRRVWKGDTSRVKFFIS